MTQPEAHLHTAPNGALLANRAHIERVLSEANLDGLVVSQPVNVIYIANHQGFNSQIGHANANFVVYPKDSVKEPILVTGAGDLWRIANNDQQQLRVIAYSAALNWQDYHGHSATASTPQAAPPMSAFAAIQRETLSARERAWVDTDDAVAGQLAATPQHALLEALKDTGLAGAKVAVDDPRIVELLSSVGHDATTCVPGDNLMRKIRVIKSPVEIAHMRHIAQRNQAAAMNTLAQIEVGATNTDINNLFRLEAAKQGAQATWAIAGSIGGLPSAEVVEGQPFLIDAVSSINHYLGDFGRTVVVGEPNKKVRDRVAMLQRGWQAALNMMRPGVKYSDIEAEAMKAMKGASPSQPNALIVPHSVGLQHTDEPYRDNLPFMVKDDLVLHTGMTLTVDFPSLELGWGNCHLEDLVVITNDGVEALGTIEDPLVIID